MKPAVLFVSTCLACAQTPQPQSDSSLIQALLSEVHQLRLAIERSNSIGPRIQLTVERMKLQQQVVSHLSDQLDSVRRDLESTQTSQTRLANQIKYQETAINQATDPNKRTSLEQELKAMQPVLEQFQQHLDSARAREADLNSRLRSEQANLDALNDRLNQIERSLPQ